jgi:hypothetical protein
MGPFSINALIHSKIIFKIKYLRRKLRLLCHTVDLNGIEKRQKTVKNSSKTSVKKLTVTVNV